MVEMLVLQWMRCWVELIDMLAMLGSNEFVSGMAMALL